MFKLLIVDDEKLDREGLQEQLPWGELGISTVETAKNGIEALEIIERIKPDILITDVKMPRMDGLSLAGKALEIVPWIKIIFVSGFDDFEFVKSALLVNAYQYILKPVDTDELLHAAQKVVNERMREIKEEEENRTLVGTINESRALLKQKLFNDILFGTFDKETIWQRLRFLDIRFYEGYFAVLLCEIDDYRLLAEEYGTEVLEGYKSAIADRVKGLQGVEYTLEFVDIDPARCAAIFNFHANVKKEMVEFRLKERAQRIVEEIGGTGRISVSVGIGCTVERMEDLGLSYTNSCQALLQKMFRGKGSVLFYQPKTSVKENVIDIQNIGNELVQSIRTCDTNKGYYCLDYLFDSIEANHMSEDRFVQNYCINLISRMEISLLEMNERLENIFGEGVIVWEKLMKFETIPDIRQWMKNVFRAVIEHLENKNSRKNRKVVLQLMKYIEENYARELTLKDIANHFYYTPNYLGMIFKEELEQGFAEYLAEFRMKKAAELLLQRHLKLYEVAEMVGYRNVSSFINQFKLCYAMTPGEYRERSTDERIRKEDEAFA